MVSDEDFPQTIASQGCATHRHAAAAKALGHLANLGAPGRTKHNVSHGFVARETESDRKKEKRRIDRLD